MVPPRRQSVGSALPLPMGYAPRRPTVRLLIRFADLAGMATRTVLRLLRVAVSLLIVAGFLWSLCFAWIRLSSEEGAMPPRWRIPEVPAGATVLDDGMDCASGGCWWSLTLRPPPGRSPEELRRQMGLETEEEPAPTLTDPGFVVRGAHVRRGNVVVYVGYA
jgi:hypothetical protein